ncbi:glycoside hydrolase family 65 protein [Acidithrix sp. C25]|uniref:glycoside hydrolase family 65 protein n=1 Tax=Acidithrix sp. C25 TaxID=1671482 RepID=UPI00191BA508|nr:glycoside hydrolase family 65 protein [Acidithrix sp. C25]
MIQHPAFTIEPWCLRETELNLNILAQTESLFALSNGHIGWRGNLDEGDPYGLSGSYLNGVHELRPLSYAEAGYSYSERDQVVVNVTDGKLIRLLVDDEPFDVRYGELHSHERVLDFRAGVLDRRVEWSSPSDRRVRIASTRLVSLVQRSVAAIRYEIEAVDHEVRVVVQSELVTNEPPPPPSGDPRVSAVLDSSLQAVGYANEGTRCELVHHTKHSEITVAAAMDHEVEGPDSTEVVAECSDDLGRLTVAVTLEPGECLTIVKYVTYGWSATRSEKALRDQIDAALLVASRTGWEGLLAEQRKFLEDFWDRADVEVDGDDEIQQAARFSLFHVLQSGARGGRRAIPGKGLTGPGYDGHAFWDSETFVLSVLTYTMPDAVAHALSWRHDTLASAKARASNLGLKGALFPWRTITGAACSAYWPAGVAAFHVNADIADAVIRYVKASADEKFERGVGLELLSETARLWYSLGHFVRDGGFRIDGVTGPDEYSAISDNNIYTNLMAQRNLRAAADVAERYCESSRALEIEEAEILEWRRAADAVVIPFDAVLGVHSQSERFTDHQVWDFATTSKEQYPLFLNFPYFDLYRKQVIKQADLVLAMYLRGDAFTLEQKRRNFEYYEKLTVRDSSLSVCCQAIIAAEVGYLALAYDYLAEAALMDLEDLEHDTRDGLHVASLAGTWIALVAGFGGMRESNDTLTFAPRLPEGITRLAFNMEFRGRRLRVEVTPSMVSYVLTHGDDLELFHFDRAMTVSTSGPTVFTLTHDHSRQSTPSMPSQPFGRTPRHRVTTSSHEQQEAP